MDISEEFSKHENLRQFLRQEFRQGVQFELEGPQQLGWALGCDISQGGLKMNFENFVPVNTEMLVRFELPNGKAIELSGQVVWANQVPHSERYQLGLKFTENQPSETAKQELHRYFQSYTN